MNSNGADQQIGVGMASVEAVVPSLTRLALLTDKEVLATVEELDRLESLVHTARAAAIAEAERREAAEHVHLCSTATFLTRMNARTNRQANALVREAMELRRFAIVSDACRSGRVSTDQLRGILAGLKKLPGDLPTTAGETAHLMMVDFAEQFGPDDLRRMSRAIWERLDPDGYDRAEADRLEAEARAAHANRRFSIAPDGCGSMIISGSVPLVDGEQLRALIDAHTQSIWCRHIEQPKGQQVPMTRAQVRADALIVIVRRATATGDAPTHGGDRPRITVLTSLDALRTGLAAAQLPCGEQLDATEVRRLACDADILPITLDGKGIPLDVGQLHRLVTPGIRAALGARDRGCVFPGCDRPPGDCEAHHVRPWWADGPTCLANLALLCPHHHRTVEPGHDRPWDRDNPYRWAIRMVEGLPVIIPPALFDPVRRPRRHARFLM
ncbi:HNH endonuclease signature motif containing protein [Enemella evansiae]|uniref:HNH endonuclease signature motif containing protein n=1 Tax=Enemella evansiae TaxID=2016499 RepID=UPI0015C652F2|nr:HNH endonuclease signature motif containing protein [Enemella evansiae]